MDKPVPPTLPQHLFAMTVLDAQLLYEWAVVMKFGAARSEWTDADERMAERLNAWMENPRRHAGGPQLHGD